MVSSKQDPPGRIVETAGASECLPVDRDRKIIHLDMDAFFAAVEQRDNPALQGRPVIVGGSPTGRGVVATCSYEARRYGIHSAMPAARALRLCPEAVFIRPRFEVYRAVSATIRALFLQATPLVEMVSLDEAYLDVTGTPLYQGSATRIARWLKQQVLDTTGLTVSAGVSYNKFLAKQASEADKPDGLHVIPPGLGADYVARLPIGRFHGVGRATEARMHALGIRTGADLAAWDPTELERRLGSRARYLHQAAQGIDPRRVEPVRQRRSLGAETTLEQDLVDRQQMLDCLQGLVERVLSSLASRGLEGRTLTLKVRYADFHSVTRSRSEPVAFVGVEQTMAVLRWLLAGTEAGVRPVRLLGVSLSSLQPRAGVAEPMQLALCF